MTITILTCLKSGDFYKVLKVTILRYFKSGEFMVLNLANLRSTKWRN